MCNKNTNKETYVTEEPYSKDENSVQSASLIGDVKSTAIVKYAAVETPAKFSKLQCNTNLKQPPANWLRSDSKSGLKGHYTYGGTNSEKFTSFNMADEFPDCLGEVDVVSDAENIKKLLKIPYSKGHVSMMVHRIRKTLLLDEFDIQRHLLRASKDEWQWLKKFYFEQVLQNLHNKSFPRKNKSRDHLLNKSMFSKFLYHSIAVADDRNLLWETLSESSGPSKSNKDARSSESPVPITSPPSQPDVPDPTDKQQRHHHEFQRNVVWNFEDICMLIGTDMPIFGGGTHPAVSLRLGEMGKPINILTGLDYWLDNLMCNVPELVMCYHLDGIVQKYELLKTEDIPHIENSQFSPIVIKYIAQNILSFLKSNATKEGHTYWLFKGTNDDIVKLYDLTSLCTLEDKEENPFTVPVAILLFRVARNMKQAQDSQQQSGTIATLLKKFLDLLNNDKYDEFVISAHQMLADLYLSDGYNVYQSYEEDSDIEENVCAHKEKNNSQDENNELTNYLEVKTLSIPDKHRNKYREVSHDPPAWGSLEERCRNSLDHVSKGLFCLQKNIAQLEKEKLLQEQSQTNRAKPNHAIPLHYKNEDEKDKFLQVSCKTSNSSMPIHCRSWQNEYKILLFSKSLQAYNILANTANNLKKFGRALRYIRLALHSYSACQVLCEEKTQDEWSLISSVLMAAGDVHLMLAHNNQSLDAYKEDYDFTCDIDKMILESIRMDIKECVYDWACDFAGGIEQSLLVSIYCYEKVVDLMKQNAVPYDKMSTILKRLGNARNEMGVFYMNLSSTINGDGSKDVSSILQEVWKKGFACFETGIQVFDKIKDMANIALLNSNMARLMRMCASAALQSLETNREFTAQERHCYKKAIHYYHIALRSLEDSKKYPHIWDSINWELSSTYYIMATQLQDCAPLSKLAREQVEKEVTELMMKALKLCDVETQSVRQPLCQYRAATIHYRLASLYHNSYRNQVSEQKNKQLRTLAESHYSKASKFFQLVDHPVEYLRIQLERVAMCEFQLGSQPGFNSKVKILQSALDYILECSPILQAIDVKLKEVTDLTTLDQEQVSFKQHSTDLTTLDQEQVSFKQHSDKLLGILEQRLQFILFNLTKTFSSKRGRATDDHYSESYKKLYGLSLRSNADSKHLCQDLQTVLFEIQKARPKH